MVREKLILVREKSVKSQGISFQTKSGHPADSDTIGGEVFETVEGEGRYVYDGLGRLL